MLKLKWGLIGCGDISRKRIAPALRDLDNSDFIAVSRSDFNLAESFAKEFNVSKWYKTWHQLLADPEIDAVYIATPVYLHAPITIAAAEAGKHVLCEKPIALNNEHSNLMTETCRKHHVKFGIAYYRHFYPAIKRIKELIKNDEIGKVVHVQINAFEYFNPKPGEPRYWLLEKEKAGGGPMFDFGCHRIEVLLNLLGNINSVEGFLNNVLFKREVEDTATAVFNFDSGATAVLNVTHAALEPQDTLTVFGSKGSIHVPVLNKGTLIIKNKSGEMTEKYPPHPNFHLPLIEDFSDAVLHNTEPAVNGEIGKEVNRILSLIYL